MKKIFFTLTAFAMCLFIPKDSMANWELNYCYCGDDLTYSCDYPSTYGCQEADIRQCCFNY